MAAVAYTFTQPLGLDPTGKPIIECRYFVTDPAIEGAATALSVVVVLDPRDPTNWDSLIESAVIADALAQPTPYVVAPELSYTPVYSDSLNKDSYSYSAPTTGFTFTINNNVEGLLLNPAGLLASGQINMPSNPANGRVVKISSSQPITALTMGLSAGQLFAGGSALTTMVANQAVAYIYRAPLKTWFRWV